MVCKLFRHNMPSAPPRASSSVFFVMIVMFARRNTKKSKKRCIMKSAMKHFSKQPPLALFMASESLRLSALLNVSLTTSEIRKNIMKNLMISMCQYSNEMRPSSRLKN